MDMHVLKPQWIIPRFSNNSVIISSSVKKEEFESLICTSKFSKQLCMGKVPEDLIFVIFFSLRNTFFKVFPIENVRHFTYHWLRKFLVIFQPIIVQNFKV